LPAASGREQILQTGEEVDGTGNTTVVFSDADFGERLQIAQLDAGRLGGQQVRGVDQALRGRELAFGVISWSVSRVRLGLLGHGAAAWTRAYPPA